MARWQKRQDFLPLQTVSAGQAYRWEITREFPIESIVLFLRVKTGSASQAATFNGLTSDHFKAAIKRVQVSVADGARTRNVVDISGPGLLDYWEQVCGQISDTWAIMNKNNIQALTASKHYVFDFPIPFALPNLSDPIASALCLPAPRYNSNIVLTVQMCDALTDIASDANLGTGGSMELSPMIIRRDIRDPKWPYFDSELAELSFTLPASSPNQMIELQVPGAYTGILLRGYLNGGAKGDPTISAYTGAATIGEVSLRVLGNVLRRGKWQELFFENCYSSWVRSASVGSNTTMLGEVPYCLFDFISDKPGQVADDLGSVLDTNPLMATGARLQLYIDSHRSSASTLKIVTHRIFGVLDAAKPSGA